MGLKRIRVDSVAELQKKKSPEQLAKENEALKQKVSGLEAQLTDTQVALCEVYEIALGGAAGGVV